MKAKDAKVKMKVKSKVNSLVDSYTIEKVNKTTCWVSCDCGKIMRGGKMVPNIITHKGVRYSILQPIDR